MIFEDNHAVEIAIAQYARLADELEDDHAALEITKSLIIADAIKAPLYGGRALPGAGEGAVMAAREISESLSESIGMLADAIREVTEWKETTDPEKCQTQEMENRTFRDDFLNNESNIDEKWSENFLEEEW